jgi:hypothetical protein
VNRGIRLAIIMAVLLGIGVIAFIVKRGSADASQIDPGLIAASYPVLLPDLCRTLVAVGDGDRTSAYNLFYKRAHSSLHLLDADVDRQGTRGRQIGTALRLAKSKVEAEIVTFPPTLEGSVAALISVAGDALQEVGFTGDTSC